MRIGIYDPYLHILGGAEKYALSIAACFPKAQVVLFNADEALLNNAEKKFGTKLDNMIFTAWQYQRSKRRKILAELDLLFYFTDGSLFFSSSKKNILIIQSPVHIPPKNLINIFKIKSWQKIICYSEFVKKIIKDRTGWISSTLFVPIDLPAVIKAPKKNIILTVGRFFPHLHNKKQKEMVEIFKELVNEGLEDTILYLVGSVDPGAEAYFEEIKQLVRGYPIKLVTQATYIELSDLYRKAKVYWHATGMGENLEKHPEKAEHFGVSTLEAMAHRAIPLIFPGGGQTEIVQHQVNGLHFWDGRELKQATKTVLSDEKLRLKLGKAAYISSLNYGQNKFCQRLNEILEK